MPSKRVGLPDGHWVEVRTKQTLADIEALEEARHARGGYPSDALDMLVIVRRVITAWDYDEPCTPENVMTVVDVADLQLIAEAMAPPNNSRPSSDGEEQEKAEELLPVDGA